LNELEAALLLSLFDVLENGVQIVVKTGGVSLSYPANLVNNCIVHGLESSSSSGVQMIGALNPLALQTASITGRIAALAKWRQFHVNKKGTAPSGATSIAPQLYRAGSSDEDGF
jgi:hypothetical protein